MSFMKGVDSMYRFVRNKISIKLYYLKNYMKIYSNNNLV